MRGRNENMKKEKIEKIYTTCVLRKVRVGQHDRAGVGLWWEMDIRGKGIMDNPIKADMRFVNSMLDLCDVEDVTGLEGQKLKLTYSYSPRFHIHSLGQEDRTFDFDEYRKTQVDYLKKWIDALE